jgi:hypothetical protein
MRRDGTVLGESAVGRKLVALTTRRVIILVRRRRALFSLMEVPQDFHRFPNSIHGWSSKLRHKQTQALSPLSNLYQAFSLDTDGLSLSYRYWWCYFACPSRPFWQTWDDAADSLHCLPVSATTFPVLTRHLLSTTITQIWLALSGWWCFWLNLSKSLTSHLPLLRTSASYGANTVFEKFVPKAWTLSCATHCPVEHCGCNATCNKKNKRECAPAPAHTYTYTQNLYGWCRLRSDPSRTWIRDHSCGFWASCHVDNT